ncbi:CRTAC1 family protein [Maribacter polysiphoniae]|uniref:CRTAC1 family protein n=1 Tax=Maribacter polysiphoniae TaxID=429344 RepID=A0A316E5D4_9FLAO|nr:CRTAC1 family protein [Maribacter polysiphoniae]MBD1259025.1 CRTAC1 family protein [Maribacter polysiphoniae]PWK24579.1 VCBS repeat protein [Maribacter polysiphoniae]
MGHIFRTVIYSILVGCLPVMLCAQGNDMRFKEVTKKAGIDFKYTFGDRHYENILESSGSGITVFDYNNDGFMDLYMMNGTYLEGISQKEGSVYKNTANKLYKNNGDGTFTEVAKSAGVDDRHWSMAAGAIDMDNDGYQDLYLLNYGPNVFYHNNGDGTFSEQTKKLGLTGPEKLNGFVKWSIGVSFWDYNNDGRLDAMVGNFLAFDPKYISTQTPGMMPHPSEYKGQASMLYQQMADGTFKDVTEKENLYYPDSKCMGLTVYDYDDDGDLDIVQANDHHENFLFKNENGTFKEVGIASGIAVNSQAQVTGSMHATIGDVDGDGLVDMLVADLKYGALYRNMGNGLYQDITESSGVARSLAGKGSWGTALFDYDNDGDLDIISANGTAEELILQYPLLLENDGKGNFKDVGKKVSPYFSTKRSGRGLAVWDYDNDGKLDVMISHVDLMATPTLLHNEAGNNNNWLGVKLTGKNGLASGIGAKLTLKTGDRKLVRINQWTTGYLSNNEPRTHFGLGKSSSIKELEIKWPDGKIEIIKNIVPNQYLTIAQGKGILN